MPQRPRVRPTAPSREPASARGIEHVSMVQALRDDGVLADSVPGVRLGPSRRGVSR
jgi:hypothetical protein